MLHQLVEVEPNLSGGHSDVEPPESIPNSEVKHVSADGSVGSPYVRVGHRQALNKTNPSPKGWGFLFVLYFSVPTRAWACDKTAWSGFERCLQRPEGRRAGCPE